METTSTIRARIDALPERRFLRHRDVADAGTYESVAKVLSRLVETGTLARVRTGLYWKGPKTRLGMVRPTPLEIALEIAGEGAGPAGISAARVFGLTTQLPSTELVAVPGRVPAGAVRGVRFTSRPARRAAEGLSPVEVAAVEVLRSGTSGTEATWPAIADRLLESVRSGAIRAEKVRSVVLSERRPESRERWKRIEREMLDASA